MKFILEKIANVYLITIIKNNQIAHIAQFRYKSNALAFIKLVQKRNKKEARL